MQLKQNKNQFRILCPMKYLTGFSFFLFALIGFGQNLCQHNKHQLRQLRSSVRDSEVFNTRSDTVDVLHYDLNLDLTDFAGAKIKGVATVQFVPKLEKIGHINLDLLKLTVDSVKQEGKSTSFNHTGELLRINLKDSVDMKDTAKVTVYYQGNPAKDAKWGGFFFESGYAFNMGVGMGSQPHNFGRVWHPCFDNFVEKASYDMHIITANGNVSHANGYLVDEIISADTTTRHWRIDEIIPTYLACVAASKYTEVSQEYSSLLTGTKTPMKLVSQAGDTTNFKKSFVNLGGAVNAFEKSFGPYLWNKVGFVLVPFNSGAMEHATAIAYPRYAIAGGSLGHEALMAHELAHHWWGNLVTCKTSEDMWINEGFASYCGDALFAEHIYGRESYIKNVRDNHFKVLHKTHVRDEGFRAVSGIPHQHTYGSHSYDKGADMAHVMRTYLGEEEFFSGCQSFMKKFAFKSASAEEFRDCLTDSTSQDMTTYFDDWIFQPGFTQFAIDSFVYTENNGTYDVIAYVKQRLRAAPSYFTNVPMQITCRNDNWVEDTSNIILSGHYSVVSFQSKVKPVVAYLNGGDLISMACTGDNSVVGTETTYKKDYSQIQFAKLAVEDSAWVRTEMHWVAADSFVDPTNYNYYVLSPDRYWSVITTSPNSLKLSGKFFFDGKQSGNGYYDVGLFKDHSSIDFHEDSLVLFYRPEVGKEWTVHPFYTKKILGSSTDGRAHFEVDSLWSGEYTFGFRIASGVGISKTDAQIDFGVYPNPADDLLVIDLKSLPESSYTISISDLEGKVVHQANLTSTTSFVSVEAVNPGSYLLSILENGKFIGSKKVLIN